VIGRHGLLGHSLELELAKTHSIWTPETRTNWQDQSSAVASLRQDCERFFQSIKDADWSIAWCAGRSIVGSSNSEIDRESGLIETLFDAIKVCKPIGVVGKVFFASSAGGVYAGALNEVIDEDSQPKPIATYGFGKLAHEEIFINNSKQLQINCLIGRITNLYGPGQDMTKSQGLISQLCRSNLTKKPLNIFVPLQTARNYLYVDDAAAMIAEFMQHDDELCIKIFASPQSTTVATLIRTSYEVFKRRPLISLGVNERTLMQPMGLHFNSKIKTEIDQRQFNSLSSGLAKTIASLAGSAHR
jgi:UDP-glucose 4-epimerase